MKTLYEKVGRKYVAAAQAMSHDMDVMRVGEWRMTYCHEAGVRRYEYNVTPDTASFEAACMLARAAMEEAIIDMALASPSESPKPYTKKQLALIAQFRADMAACGGMLPAWWGFSSSFEIAEAGVNAIRTYKP